MRERLGALEGLRGPPLGPGAEERGAQGRGRVPGRRGELGEQRRRARRRSGSGFFDIAAMRLFLPLLFALELFRRRDGDGRGVALGLCGLIEGFESAMRRKRGEKGVEHWLDGEREAAFLRRLVVFSMALTATVLFGSFLSLSLLCWQLGTHRQSS